MSVLVRLLVAPLAAGVLTAFPAGAGAWLVGVVPMLLPVVPWLRALLVFGPGEPPVPLIVWPFDNVPPGEPPAPVAAPVPLPTAPPVELLPAAPPPAALAECDARTAEQ